MRILKLLIRSHRDHVALLLPDVPRRGAVQVPRPAWIVKEKCQSFVMCITQLRADNRQR
jgi:hypothetical protein|tara:strand:- start:2850 stop:3026 length:177 start_codon:yes stop_codon:yes gene_type:complete